MDFKTKYMIGLEERISLTEKLTILQAQLREQENINNDLLKHINTIETSKCPHCTVSFHHQKTHHTIAPLQNSSALEELDSRQPNEQQPITLNNCRNNPTSDFAESKPKVSVNQTQVSGKKPFNYQQFSQYDLSSDSESDTPSEHSNQEQIDLDDDKLVAWAKIVKQNHPKLLKPHNHSSWEKYVLEFLGKI